MIINNIPDNNIIPAAVWSNQMTTSTIKPNHTITFTNTDNIQYTARIINRVRKATKKYKHHFNIKYQTPYKLHNTEPWIEIKMVQMVLDDNCSTVKNATKTDNRFNKEPTVSSYLENNCERARITEGIFENSSTYKSKMYLSTMGLSVKRNIKRVCT